MKKMLGPLLLALLIFSCANSDDGRTPDDSTNINVNANVGTGSDAGDTSSYERMPGRLHDSIPR